MYLVFGVMLHVRYFLLGMKSSMVAMATPKTRQGGSNHCAHNITPDTHNTLNIKVFACTFSLILNWTNFLTFDDVNDGLLPEQQVPDNEAPTLCRQPPAHRMQQLAALHVKDVGGAIDTVAVTHQVPPIVRLVQPRVGTAVQYRHVNDARAVGGVHVPEGNRIVT